ncbi:GNAT family N-acetyltransferase [Aestuariimicrobium sp. T2.26MG-19.2B]|uniref:GNAT family N-acetyltransferase n=1 Tax=Aestuariimicrobium sp. T2.26MG-19.2B TaxID=3040679 RepID=UPI002477323A|nr:GNAT family N-acetyltransferase [Aestuariimicrobium sp. T2.26MG-19.2B]CAI9398899.1 Mycothiol acetyltransferase [Aestuariimicrobium sp. T2.26MG-19.2B]
MSTRLRVLGNADVAAALELLRPEPISNLFLRARFAHHGLDRVTLGCEVLGFERNRQLVALCHVGSNLVPAGDDTEALAAFAAKIGARRHSSSIMGRAPLVRGLFDHLVERHQSWGHPRELRYHQPLMVIDHDSPFAGDPRVRQVTLQEFEPYFDAAVKMYTEEVGVSPLDPSGGYRSHMRRLVMDGQCYAIIEDGRVLFKADVGTAYGTICQIQGVWLAPELRGQGLSVPAMAKVIELVRERYPVVSLYVNDFNTRARKLYERCGMRTIDALATVLY